MKNVLLITQGFPYGISEQSFLSTEYRRLPDKFHLCVCAFGDTEEPGFPLPERVTHLRYSWPVKPSIIGLPRQLRHAEVRADIASLLQSGKRGLLPRLGWILLYSYRAEQIEKYFRDVIRENKIDIVYTYWCVQATVTALRLKTTFPGLRVVTRFHGMDLYEELYSRGWQPLRPYIARNCDRLIFICQAGMDYFLAHWGREWAAKSAIIHVGCRAMPCCKTDGDASKPLVLVSCSSVIPIKRVALIVDGLAALPASVCVRWHHIGGGELMNELQEHAAAVLAKRTNIQYTLHGSVLNAELPKLYAEAEARLFITTSETEGLPVSIMEAFAMGIPAVATAVGGIPEMVKDGETGFLMDANPSPVQVAETLQRYLALTEAEKRTMSQAAIACWRKDYDAEINAEKLIRLLNRVAGEGNAL